MILKIFVSHNYRFKPQSAGFFAADSDAPLVFIFKKSNFVGEDGFLAFMNTYFYTIDLALEADLQITFSTCVTHEDYALFIVRGQTATLFANAVIFANLQEDIFIAEVNTTATLKQLKKQAQFFITTGISQHHDYSEFRFFASNNSPSPELVPANLDTENPVWVIGGTGSSNRPTPVGLIELPITR